MNRPNRSPQNPRNLDRPGDGLARFAREATPKTPGTYRDPGGLASDTAPKTPERGHGRVDWGGGQTPKTPRTGEAIA